MLLTFAELLNFWGTRSKESLRDWTEFLAGVDCSHKIEGIVDRKVEILRVLA